MINQGQYIAVSYIPDQNNQIIRSKVRCHVCDGRTEREKSKCNIMSRLRNIFLSSSPNNFITPPTPLCSWNSSITLFQSGRRPLQAGKVTQYKLIQETTLQFCEDSASTLILKILVLCTNVQSPPAFEGGTTQRLR